MSYEVELKFALDDAAAVLAQLDKLQATKGTPVEQRDRYFNHPLRDFAKTGEALRLRTVGERGCLTYKGPLIDTRTKTRREIEIPIGRRPADASRFAEILDILGFHEVRTVQKTRLVYKLFWEDRNIELAFDEVVGLGTYLEIETAADESDCAAAGDSILRFAGQLGLRQPIRKSYLTLLLEKENDG